MKACQSDNTQPNLRLSRNHEWRYRINCECSQCSMVIFFFTEKSLSISSFSGTHESGVCEVFTKNIPMPVLWRPTLVPGPCYFRSYPNRHRALSGPVPTEIISLHKQSRRRRSFAQLCSQTAIPTTVINLLPEVPIPGGLRSRNVSHRRRLLRSGSALSRSCSVVSFWSITAVQKETHYVPGSLAA